MALDHPYNKIKESLPAVSDVSSIYLKVSDKNFNYLQIFDSIITLSDIVVSNWLNITTRTLRNYRKIKNLQLKDTTKEHIITILALYKHGIEVFSSRDNFEKWLSTQNILLDNKAPLDFLDTFSGIQLIDNRLTAIEFGENA
ncbi:MAG: MbcA/ParS/Xre antitoxin family protein [Crocinitomicaceae bacterium]|nr:MbcA/ParS/Xre antitoxin family protein [Crocinitomicaceae bacterium]